MGVARHLILSQDTHFGSIHLVSVDEVAEEGGVGVDEVERLVQDQIREVSQMAVEGVVLKMSRVKVLASVLIASVVSYNSHEIVHSEVVWIVPVWSLKSN